MPQKSENSIHNPKNQVGDFFRDDQMRRLFPRNPYNIHWMIETYLLEKYQKIDKKNNNTYYTDILKKMQHNSLYFIHQEQNYELRWVNNPALPQAIEIPILILQDLLNDDYVFARVKGLHEKHNISLDFLSSRTVRTKSIFLLNSLLNLGMDPNVYSLKNFPMQVALNRKIFKIFHILWNHPKINRYQKIIETNENMAFIAAKEQSWKALSLIFQDAPELFLEKNHQEETVLDVIAKFNKGKKLFKVKNEQLKEAVPNKMRNLLLDIATFLDENDIISSNKTNEEMHEIIITAKMNVLEKKLSNQKISSKTIKL